MVQEPSLEESVETGRIRPDSLLLLYTVFVSKMGMRYVVSND
jgi:hypothetical protein